MPKHSKRFSYCVGNGNLVQGKAVMNKPASINHLPAIWFDPIHFPISGFSNQLLSNPGKTLQKCGPQKKYQFLQIHFNPNK
jgi:hypothetical protein